MLNHCQTHNTHSKPLNDIPLYILTSYNACHIGNTHMHLLKKEVVRCTGEKHQLKWSMDWPVLSKASVLMEGLLGRYGFIIYMPTKDVHVEGEFT